MLDTRLSWRKLAIQRRGAVAQADTELVNRFDSDITVRVNGMFYGVCLCGYRNPITSRASLRAFFRQLDKVAERGDALVATLAV